jgi:hypothetical protein
MTVATYARIAFYGDKLPDPRTATCAQHMIASPASDTAAGDGTDIDPALGWECVVCPIPNADLIGTEVIVAGHQGSTYLYGGDHPHYSVSIAYSLRGGGNVVRASVDNVAPADTPQNPKDPRITIEKLAHKRDYNDSGVWLPHIDHPNITSNLRARKTKKEAVAYAANRLAIEDYHVKRTATQATV